jgi:hypothetical protein
MYQVAIKAVEMQREVMYEDLARRIAANVSKLFKR